ncbi:hypothetical protein H7Y40_00770 [Pedobacter sp.]|nr:hypothetical protein [Candidatus Saccharibacteria bacterium]
MKKYISQTHNGFTMPAILIVSSALFVIALATLQAAISIQSSINNQYYNKLAQEAAEAGAAYAYACLENNAHLQTWTTPLTQKTDCNGTNTYSYASISPSVSNIKATFSVGDLEVSTTNTYQIAASGTVNITNSSGTSTIKTFSRSLKKSVSWQNQLAGKSASGSYRTCGLVNGSAYCWGDNDWGQLGNGKSGSPANDSLVPVKVVRDPAVLGAKIITDIAAGTSHNCVLAAGEVFCWGQNTYGQLGNNTTTNSSVPVKVQGLPATMTAVATSTNSSCAIATGEVYCWGRNNQGQLGNNKATGSSPEYRSLVAVKISGVLAGKTTTDLATSGSRSYHMCAIADGLAYCWGDNTNGNLGNNSTTDSNVPVAVSTVGVLAGKTVTDISAEGLSGAVSTCVVASGAAYCWGSNDNGKVGNGISGNSDYKTPQAVSTSGVLTGKTVTDINVGNNHTCALADAKAYCWGANNYGQLGNNQASGTATKSLLPVAVSEIAGAFLGQAITNLGGGANRGCAAASNKIYCWGWNTRGQIGDGTIVVRKIPTESIFLRPKNNIFIF